MRGGGARGSHQDVCVRVCTYERVYGVDGTAGVCTWIWDGRVRCVCGQVWMGVCAVEGMGVWMGVCKCAEGLVRVKSVGVDTCKWICVDGRV